MKPEQVVADVEMGYRGRVIRRRCLVDTGGSRSVISKNIAEELGCLIHLSEPYELRTADKDGKLKVVGYCRVEITFQGVKVPGGAVFEVAENLREGTDLVIGRPEIDAWDIIFTSEGPKPKKVPIEFEII